MTRQTPSAIAPSAIAPSALAPIPDVMTACQLTGHGGLDQPALPEDAPVPKPGVGAVLVNIAAAGRNNADIDARTGWCNAEVAEGATARGGASGFGVAVQGMGDGMGDGMGESSGDIAVPRIKGADAVGRIVAVGAGVDPARPGERAICDPLLRDRLLRDPLRHGPLRHGPSHQRPGEGEPGDPLGFDAARFLGADVDSADVDGHDVDGADVDGALAPFLAVLSENAVAVSDGVTATDAALATPPGAGGAAMTKLLSAGVRAGDAVLVAGASGGVGVSLVQVANQAGADVAPDRAAPDRVAPDRAARGRDPTSLVAAAREASGGRPNSLVADVTAGAVAGPHVMLDLRTLCLKSLCFFGSAVCRRAAFPERLRRLASGGADPGVGGDAPPTFGGPRGANGVPQKLPCGWDGAAAADPRMGGGSGGKIYRLSEHVVPLDAWVATTHDTALDALKRPLKRSLESAMVKLETNEGLVGWGETVAAPPCSLPTLATAARAALDMALRDLHGNALGAPLVDLWGGRVAEGVPALRLVSAAEPEAMLAETAAFRPQGDRLFQQKIGVGAPEDDVARLPALMADLRPGERFWFHPNRAWSFDQAMRTVPPLADLGPLIEPLCESGCERRALAERCGVGLMLVEARDGQDAFIRAALRFCAIGGLSERRRVAEPGRRLGASMRLDGSYGAGLTFALTPATAARLPHSLPPEATVGLDDDAHPDATARRNPPAVRSGRAASQTDCGSGLGVAVNEAQLGEPAHVYAV